MNRWPSDDEAVVEYLESQQLEFNIQNALSVEELDALERLAVDARRQMLVGNIDWPGRPSRQRLALFLAASPVMILRLVIQARAALVRNA